MRICGLKVFLFLALAAKIFCSAYWNQFSNFWSGSCKKHFCEIILKSSHWPTRLCCLNDFLFLALAASRVE